LIWIKATRAANDAALVLHSTDPRIIGMSVTHPSATFGVGHKELLAGHEQLKPFLLAVAMFVVSVTVALAFTGLPQ
jgi:hypothetical protein